MSRTRRAAQHAAALTLMTLVLTSCGTAPDPARSVNGGDDAIAHGTHSGSVGAAAATSFSIYDLDASWQDQLGTTLTLSDLRGRPRIVAMVYTSCAYACPRILRDMKAIEGELRAQGVDAGYVMVSIDPERDTPARLSEYAASTMLDPWDWTLLTGTEDGVLELATLLGVRYRRISETDFEHSNVITLVDADGRIVMRQVGLGAEPEAMVRAAAALPQEPASGT
jgi:protein SCO1/2